MNYHLENEIRLIKEAKSPNLYNWALQEFDKDGVSITSELIPWGWGVDFVASELRYVSNVEITSSKEEKLRKSSSECIHVALKPEGRKGLAEQRPPHFSMLGTNRKIKDFSLTIRSLEKDEDIEHCKVWGIVSYTAEIDFRHRTTNDDLGFEIWLKPQNFDTLRHLVQNKSSDDALRVHVKGVAGFYSEWSPAISTSSVKVLARGGGAENCEDGGAR